MLREYPLFCRGETSEPLDHPLQATLAEFYPAPLATGENLFSHQDARNLIHYGGRMPADPGSAACRTVATRCRWQSPPVRVSAAMQAIPTCSSRRAGSPTARA